MEKVVVSVLNSVLGTYVKEFDRSKLDLSVWKGEARIQQVELRPDALDFLDLPIAIKVGFIGEIFVEADWKKLSSKPVRVSIDDVRIVCGPRSKFSKSAEVLREEAKKAQQSKQQWLESWETLSLVPQDDVDAAPDASYTARLTEKIIDNIHINIKKIHIRYEDSTKGRMFAFGISIRELGAVTTNERGDVEFVNQTGQYVYKSACLTDFSVYLNCFASLASDEYMKRYFDYTNKDVAKSLFDGTELRQYLIEPSTMEVSIIQNKNAEKDGWTIPSVKIKGSISQLNISLAEDQFRDLLNIVSNISIAGSYGKYLATKPMSDASAGISLPVKSNPRKYWKWAIQCVMNDEKEKHTLDWSKFANFTVDRDKYIELYMRKCNATWLPALKKDDLSMMNFYEEKYEYNDIVYFRECAVTRLRKHLGGKPVILRSALPSKTTTVWKSWFGKGSSDSGGSSSSIEPLKLSSSEIRKIYIQIGNAQSKKEDSDEDGNVDFDPSSSSTSVSGSGSGSSKKKEVPAEFSEMQVQFDIEQIGLSLMECMKSESIRKPPMIMHLSFNTASLGVFVRPQNSILVGLTLQTMVLNDYYSQDVFEASMLQRVEVVGLTSRSERTRIEKSLKPLMHASFESKPLDKVADTKITANIEPVTIDVHLPVLLRLADFFTPETQVDLHAFERAALIQLESMKNATQAALSDAVTLHQSVFLDVKLKAPTVLLRSKVTRADCPTLYVDLGMLNITSKIQDMSDEKKSSEDGRGGLGTAADSDLKLKVASESLMGLISADEERAGVIDVLNTDSGREALGVYYDTYDVQLSNVKMFMDEDKPENLILQPLDVNLIVHSSIFPSQMKYPTMVMTGDIPKVDSRVSAGNIRKSTKLLESLLQMIGDEMDALEKARNERRAEELADPASAAALEAKRQAALRAALASKSMEQAEAEYFDEETKQQLYFKINFLARFNVGNVQFSLVDDSDVDNPIKLLVADIDGVGLWIQQRKWDVSTQFAVANVTLWDYLVPTVPGVDGVPTILETASVKFGSEEATSDSESTSSVIESSSVDLSGVSSPSSASLMEKQRKGRNFFEISFKSKNEGSPKYDNIDSVLIVNVGSLFFNIRPETMYEIVRLGMINFFPPITEEQRMEIRRKMRHSSMASIGSVSASFEKARKRQEKRDERRKREREAQMAKVADKSQIRKVKKTLQLSATFARLEVRICAKQYDLAHVSISGMKADVQIYPYSMDASVNLNSIDIRDTSAIWGVSEDPLLPSLENPYPYFIKHDSSLVKGTGSDLVSVRTEMYNRVEKEYPGYEMKLDVLVSGLKLVYLKRFTDELVRWLLNSKLLTITTLVTETLAQSAYGVTAEMEVGTSSSLNTTGGTTGPSSGHPTREIDLGTLAEEREHSVEESVMVVPHSESAAAAEPNAGFPQINIKIRDMRVEVPKSSMSLDKLHGMLGEVHIYNDVLTDDSLTVDLSRLFMGVDFGDLDGTREYERLKANPNPLFDMALISVKLKNEFKDVSLFLDELNLDLSYKEYEFIMHLLSGNLAENAQIAPFVYPLGNVNAEVAASHAEKLSKAGREAAAKQLEKGITVLVDIDHIALTLFRLYGVSPLRGDALVCASLESLHTGVKMAADTGAIDLEVSLKDLRLEDVSLETRKKGVKLPWRKLVGFEPPAESKVVEAGKALAVGVAMDADGNMDIQVAMDGLRVTFGSVLWTLIEFGSVPPAQHPALPPPPTTLLDDLAKGKDELALVGDFAVDDSEEKKSSSPREAEAAAAAADDERKIEEEDKEDLDELNEPINTSAMKIDIQISNTTVQMVRNPDQNESRSLILTWEMSSVIQMDPIKLMDIEASVRSLQAYQGTVSYDEVSETVRIKMREGVPKILEPVTISAQIDQYQSMLHKGSSGMAGKLAVEPMNMRFGYSDFSLFMYGLYAVAPPPLEKNEEDDIMDSVRADPDDDADAEPLGRGGDDYKSSGLGTDAADGRPSASKSNNNSREELKALERRIVAEQLYKQDLQMAALAKQLEQQTPLIDFGEMEFDISIGDLYLLLINDAKSTNIPLARVKIENVNAKFVSLQQKMSVTAQLSLFADYFFPDISVWEPIIEPWGIKAAFFQYDTGAMVIEVLPTEALNINVTHAMAKAVQKSLELIQSDESSSDDPLKSDADAASKKAVAIEDGTDGESTSVVMVSSSAVDDDAAPIKRRRSSVVTIDESKETYTFASLDSTPTHVLDNRTEFAVTITQWNKEGMSDMDVAIEKSKCSSKLTEKLVVPPMSEEGFYAPSSDARGLGVSLSLNEKWETFSISDCNTISFGLNVLQPFDHLSGAKAVESAVGLGMLASSAIKVAEDISDPFLMVNSTIEFQGGQKVIRLHSPAEFRNRTSVPLCFFDGTPPVQPWKSGYCPVMNFARDLQFPFSPWIEDESSGERIKFGSQMLPLSTYEENGSQVIHFRSGSLQYSFVCNTWKEDEKQLIVFEFRPLMRVTNFLTDNLAIGFSGLMGDGKTAASTTVTTRVRPGESIDAFCLGNSVLTEASIEHKGLVWNGTEDLTKHYKKAKEAWKETSEMGYKSHKVELDFMDKARGQLNVICDFSFVARNACSLTFYVPYWFYDLTGLGLLPYHSRDAKAGTRLGGVRTTGSVYDGMKQQYECEPLMFNFPKGDSHDSVRVKGKLTQFSERFSPNAVGTYARIERLFGQVRRPPSSPSEVGSSSSSLSKTTSTPEEFELEVGVEVSLVTGIFRGMINSVRLVPRHRLINNLKFPVEVRQIEFHRGRPEDLKTIMVLQPGENRVFHWRLPADQTLVKRKDLQFRVKESNCEWSSFLRVGEVGNKVVQVSRKKADPWLLDVRTIMKKATCFISINEADLEFPPIIIENRTLTTTFRFCQKHVNLWRSVEPLSTVPYGWHDHSRESPMISLNLPGKSEMYDYSMEETKNYPSISAGHFTLFVAVEMRGPSKVLLISDFPIPPTNESNGLSIVRLKQPDLGPYLKKYKKIVAERVNYINRDIATLDRKIAALKSSKAAHKASMSSAADLNDDESSVVSPRSPASGSTTLATELHLLVEVIEARNLAIANTLSGDSDPYVIVTLGKEQHKTEVKNKTRNPIWHAQFDFKSRNPAKDFRQLQIAVNSKSMIFQDDFLGGVLIDLDIIFRKGKACDKWFRLQKPRQAAGLRGDIHLRITPLASEVARDSLRIKEYTREKKTFLDVKTRTLMEIGKKERIDLDALNRQHRHRIAITQWFFSDESLSQDLFVVLRAGPYRRRVQLGETLYSYFPLDETVYLHKKRFPSKIKFEVWITHRGTGSISSGTASKTGKLTETTHELIAVVSMDKKSFAKKYTKEELIEYKKKQAKGEASSSSSSSSSDSSSSLMKKARKATFNSDILPTDNARKITPSQVKWMSDRFRTQRLELTVSWSYMDAPPPSLRSQLKLRSFIPEIGISIVDGSPRELLFISASKLKLELTQSIEQNTIESVIDNFQIDVQRRSARYCSLLAPAPQLPEKKQPFLHLSINTANVSDTTNLTVVQYFSLLVQKMSFQFEERVLWDLVNFGREFVEGNSDDYIALSKDFDLENVRMLQLYDTRLSGSDSNAANVDNANSNESRFFFKVFYLQPLALDITVGVDASSRPTTLGGGPLVALIMRVVNIVLGMIGNIENARFRLNALGIDNAYGGIETLINPIAAHYYQQCVRESYKLVGSLNLLGNPAELVHNLGSGVKDFFFEPAQGLVESPSAFARGLGKGTTSLLSKTISGTFGTVSKVTSAVGKGTELLTFDEEYQQQRKLAQQSGPKHVGDGLFRGFKSLGKGVFDGVTGVVTKPVEGAKKEGMFGFGKGVAKGIGGLVFKPVTGVVDLATESMQGIANTAEYIDMSKLPPIERHRMPRFLRKGQAMLPFNTASALQQTILWELGEHGLDDEQKKGVGTLELIDMRERERLLYSQLIHNGEVAVLATNLRLCVVHLLKRKLLDEYAADKSITQVESIVAAYFGKPGLSPRSNKAKERSLVAKFAINVTDKIRDEFLDKSSDTLDLEGMRPMHVTFGDPAPGVRKTLYLYYVPASGASKITTDFFGGLKTSKKGVRLLLPSRRLSNEISVDGSRVILMANEYASKISSDALDLDSKSSFSVDCQDESEARLVAQMLNHYWKDLNPAIIRASYGAGNQSLDVTLKLTNFVMKRKLNRLRIHDRMPPPDFTRKLLNSDQRDPLPGQAKNLVVTYENSRGLQSRLFKDQSSMYLD